MVASWEEIWEELLNNLKGQPPCPLHREYRHIPTLNQRSINEGIKGDEDILTYQCHSFAEYVRVPNGINFAPSPFLRPACSRAEESFVCRRILSRASCVECQR